jgi:hypothetical protein
MQIAWEVVCPDGRVRQLPLMNREDAVFEAVICDARGCRPAAECDFHFRARCPGHGHRVRGRTVVLLSDIA